MNLVTGATGILGSHVVYQLLLRGAPVLAAKRKSSDLSKMEHLFKMLHPQGRALFDSIQWVEMDIQDIFSIEEALKDVTNVYHCAGYVSFDAAERQKLMDINEKGTRNVVNACLGKPGLALCHVSSVATLHNLDYKASLDETVFWKRSGRESDYALSKYNAEREVWRGIEEGLKAVIVNPAVILSPGFWQQSSSRMFETASKGNPFYTRGSAAYISGADAARIMIRLMEEGYFGERFILVDANKPYREFLTLLNSSFGKPGPRLELGRIGLRLASMGESVYNIFTGDKKRVTRAVINSILNTQKYSGGKVRKRLNYQFEPLEDLIKNISEKYRADHAKTGSSI